jgi:hypothetical protein
LSFGRFPLAFILFVLWWFSFGHYIVCPLIVFLLPLYCLSFGRFPLAIIRQKENNQRTNNIKAKGKPPKDKQYKGQRKTPKGQTI